MKLPYFQQNDPGGGPPAPPADVPDAPGGLFTLSYVKELRGEAAGHRIKARDANAALAAVAEQLGIAPEHAGDPARVRYAATALRVSASVDEAITRHGVDRRLTKAMLDSERALAPLADVQPAQYATHLDQIITALVRDNPALKVGPVAGPPRSGLPMSGGGNPNQTQISRAELAALPPERVEDLRKRGLLSHLLRGE